MPLTSSCTHGGIHDYTLCTLLMSTCLAPQKHEQQLVFRRVTLNRASLSSHGHMMYALSLSLFSLSLFWYTQRAFSSIPALSSPELSPAALQLPQIFAIFVCFFSFGTVFFQSLGIVFSPEGGDSMEQRVRRTVKEPVCIAPTPPPSLWRERKRDAKAAAAVSVDGQHVLGSLKSNFGRGVHAS